MDTDKRPFSLKKRTLSFRYAANGVVCLIKNEHNAWIHLTLLVAVITAGFIFQISGMEWISITIVSGMVLLSEGFNTAIEYLCDHISPKYHKEIGAVKDIAAGSVLIAAITAAITGLIIFVPYLLEFFKF
jgi:diacylglycerol kinase (ATP)